MPPIDDPYFAPPADLTPEDARRYEEMILSLIRDALHSRRYEPWAVESVELAGQRPHTAVVFEYREASDPGRLLAARAPIWEDITHTVGGRQVLDDAASVGGWIFSAFTAGELESREITQ